MKINRAAQRRVADQVRDQAIQMLGMAPEDRSSAATRYAATTGEMICWLRKDGVDTTALDDALWNAGR